jgi:hypothetical protein
VTKDDAIGRARRYALAAHGVDVGKLTHEFLAQLAESRANFSKRGILLSGAAVAETARIHGERITATLKSKLDRLLEGFEMYGVTLDDTMADELVKEITGERATHLSHAGKAFSGDQVLNSHLVSEASYRARLEQHVGMYPNEIATLIEQWRFMPKPSPNTVNIYHVTGHNNRWMTNSQDHSVNIVTQSSDQIFATLRQKIETELPLSDEQKDILGKLSALEREQDSPSVVQRYTEFIAAAANHMQLIAPFIPALTEILQKHL